MHAEPLPPESPGDDNAQSVLETAFASRASADLRNSSPARKVSVSIPEDLTKAVQQRVGRGKFSQYVTEAVARRLEMDLLSELAESLSAEHGPIPEQLIAEAQAAWPDAG